MTSTATTLRIACVLCFALAVNAVAAPPIKPVPPSSAAVETKAPVSKESKETEETGVDKVIPVAPEDPTSKKNSKSETDAPIAEVKDGLVDLDSELPGYNPSDDTPPNLPAKTDDTSPDIPQAEKPNKAKRVVEPHITPAQAVAAALTNLSTLDTQWQGQMRYIVCETPEEQVAVTYMLNAVSRNRVLIRPKCVQGSPTGRALLRIDLPALGSPRDPKVFQELFAAWEKLAEEDPYFHVRTQVAVAGTKEAKITTVDGGWTNIENATRLRKLSGSAGAVLRADYVVTQLATTEYYAWAGVPATEVEFVKLLGVDAKVISELAADTAANVLVSNVTHKNRRIFRIPGPLGGVNFTQDIAAEGPDKDVIRAPVDIATTQSTQRYKYDASEWFAAKANKFWLVALYDAAGKRQASVPDAVAHDTTAQNGIVQPIKSCIVCHSLHGGAGGLQLFSDDQTKLLNGQSAILKSFSPAVAQRIGELYDFPRMLRDQNRDREDYEEAVKQACNCTSIAAAQSLFNVYSGYAEKAVTKEIAAAELGVTVDTFIKQISESTDPISLSLRGGQEVTRKAWESAWQDAILRVTK